MPTVSASILSANFLDLATSIQAVDNAGVDSFHLDVMDGHFVPNLSFGPAIIEAVSRITKKPLFVHLMIDKPWHSLDLYCQNYTAGIWVHAEAYQQEKIPDKPEARYSSCIHTDKLARDLDYIKQTGIQAGVVLNRHTPIAVIDPVLDQCDHVLLMSVDPGFANQAFMPAVIPKVRQLADDYGYTGRISVDGGVNADNAHDLLKAGATDLISASYLFGAYNYEAAIAALRSPKVAG